MMEAPTQTAFARLVATVAFHAAVLTLLFEVAGLVAYFAAMSFIILVGPGNLEPPKLLALGIHMVASALYLISFFGVGFCFFHVKCARPIAKWLLITLSTLGILLLPLALYTGLESEHLMGLLYLLAAWSVATLINTIVVFRFMENRDTTAMQSPLGSGETGHDDR
jgi:hypothetical protein